MGCGEAKISQNVPNKVFSFDLVAFNDLVTACDMAKVVSHYTSIYTLHDYEHSQCDLVLVQSKFHI